jgi:hypothetical protein
MGRGQSSEAPPRYANVVQSLGPGPLLECLFAERAQGRTAALLHYYGFTIAWRYGDWNGERLTAASPSIIVVCSKRA